MVNVSGRRHCLCCRSLDLSDNLLVGTIPSALLAKFGEESFDDNCLTGYPHNPLCPSDAGNVSVAELMALRDLYVATNGAEWSNSVRGWGSATDPVSEQRVASCSARLRRAMASHVVVVACEFSCREGWGRKTARVRIVQYLRHCPLQLALDMAFLRTSFVCVEVLQCLGGWTGVDCSQTSPNHVV